MGHKRFISRSFLVPMTLEIMVPIKSLVPLAEGHRRGHHFASPGKAHASLGRERSIEKPNTLDAAGFAWSQPWERRTRRPRGQKDEVTEDWFIKLSPCFSPASSLP